MTNLNDWREDIVEKKEYPKVESFKLKSGSSEITFIDEGWEWFSQQDNKNYIIFKVQKDGDIVRPWFVNKENIPLLRELKAIGKLSGRRAVLSRTGERRATRWSVTFLNEQNKEQ